VLSSSARSIDIVVHGINTNLVKERLGLIREQDNIRVLVSQEPKSRDGRIGDGY